jgi:CobQ/CobB/MinD/ParA nucleotide binding domain
MNAPDPQGHVVTFYSYKGGTGRSMALANLAWVLATAGKRVLTIDWDLEAPGLHRYFHPFLSDPELTSTAGVIDFIIRFIEAASAQPADGTVPDDWYMPYTHIAHYANSIDHVFPDGGVLDFIFAGKQGDAYAARVNSLNWKHF